MRARSLLFTFFLMCCAPVSGEIPSAAEVRSTLEEVFNRPEFKPPVKSWAGQLWDAIRDKVAG